jgi:hypothetical protein
MRFFQSTGRHAVLKRGFSTSIIKLKELPRPSQQYMSDMGEQPIPLTESDIVAKEVADIDIPQATLDEKTEIKKAMKKRSLRMTFWQLFLITLLGSSTLNIMREKNLIEELDDNFQKKFAVVEQLIKDAEEGRITVEEAREALKSWNERFVDVFELSAVEVQGAEGLDKRKLKLAFNKIRGIKFDEDELAGYDDSEENKKPDEKLNKFL